MTACEEDPRSSEGVEELQSAVRSLFVLWAIILSFVGWILYDLITQEWKTIPWAGFCGVASFCVLSALCTLLILAVRKHADTIFYSEGILFARFFAEDLFVPWDDLKQVKRIRMLDMWVFKTEHARVRLCMKPFKRWVVDKLILDNAPSDCELLPRPQFMLHDGLSFNMPRI